jgi:LacI family transcriptional regulator
MRSGSNGPTLREVALEAGVSVPAVSKVLHGRGSSIRVSEEKAETIRAAAERLKYTPNALARSLRSSRTHNVGLVFEHFGHIAAGPQYYVHLLDGIASELFKYHYRLTILPEVPHNQVASVLQDGRLDGIIWCKLPDDRRLLTELGECTLPIIALNAPAPGASEICFISCDNETGVSLAVNHLADLGHRRILFAMEHGETETPDAEARLKGMRSAMKSMELPFGEEDIVCWDFRASGFADWFSQGTDHTAIIAWNEGLAGGIIEQARLHKVRIPAQLSVVGFDSTAYCDCTVPKLSAVRQPILEMAQEATRHLLALIEGTTDSKSSLTFPCSFDQRESTAKANPRGKGFC